MLLPTREAIRSIYWKVYGESYTFLVPSIVFVMALIFWAIIYFKIDFNVNETI